jgi:hypothetical protein
VITPPPVSTITSVSATKIGTQPDCHESSVVAFAFDQPVTAWRVRVGAKTAFDGSEAARWDRAFVGFGHQRFGTSTFGHGAGDPPAEGGVATLTADDLVIGENTVSVYGRSLSGAWTR